MKRVIKIIAISLVVLILVGLAAYRIWLYNPYEDQLRLDPRSVFSEESIPHDFLIRNAAMIDVVEGRVVPNTHIHIRNDSIAGVYHRELPDTLEYNTEYDAQGTYLIPGLIDVHTHLAMHPQLLAGIIKDRDSLVTRVALEQFVRYGVTTILTLGGGGANDEEMAELKRLAVSWGNLSRRSFGSRFMREHVKSVSWSCETCPDLRRAAIFFTSGQITWQPAPVRTVRADVPNVRSFGRGLVMA